MIWQCWSLAAVWSAPTSPAQFKTVTLKTIEHEFDPIPDARLVTSAVTAVLPWAGLRPVRYDVADVPAAVRLAVDIRWLRLITTRDADYVDIGLPLTSGHLCTHSYKYTLHHTTRSTQCGIARSDVGCESCMAFCPATAGVNPHWSGHPEVPPERWPS